MKRMAIAATAAMGSLALVTTACGAPEITSGDTVTLRFSTHGSASDHPGWAAYKEYVEKESNGSIEFQEYYSSSLLADNEALDGVASGIADLGDVLVPLYPDVLPAAEWATNLGMAKSAEWPAGLLQMNAATIETVKNNQDIQAEYNDAGVHLLGMYVPYESASMLCADPVKDKDDLKGRTVRVSGDAHSSQVRALGMTPSHLPYAEIYEGLQRGIVDCVVTGTAVFMSTGIWEVAKHYIRTPLAGYPSQAFVMNLEQWNEISPEQQRILEDGVAKWLEADLESILEDYANFASTGGGEHGIRFEDQLTDINQLLAQNNKKAIGSLPESAPSRIKRPEQFIQRYQESMRRWGSMIENDLGIQPKASRDRGRFTESEEIDVRPYMRRLESESVL